jgi:hypothetical protein
MEECSTFQITQIEIAQAYQIVAEDFVFIVVDEPCVNESLLEEFD